MKKMKILLLLVLCIYLVNSQTPPVLFERYISTTGNDEIGCGDIETNSCKSIKSALNSFQASITSGTSTISDTLVMIFGDGEYTGADNSGIDIWGYTIIMKTVNQPTPPSTTNLVSLTTLVSIFTIAPIEPQEEKTTSITMQNIDVLDSEVHDSAFLYFSSSDHLKLTLTSVSLKDTVTYNGSGLITIVSPTSKSGNISVQIENSVVSGNKAYNGTGFLNSEIPMNLTVINTSFFQNQNIQTDPGHIFSSVIDMMPKSNLNVSDSEFTSNLSGSFCGVFSNINQNSTNIVNSYFQENKGTECGVLYVFSGNLDVQTSEFKGNAATDYSAVMNLNYVDANFHNSSFTFNDAVNYGGVMTTEGGTYSFYGNIMTDNSVLGQGPTIFCVVDSTFNFDSYNEIYLNSQNTRKANFKGVDCSVEIQYQQSCLFYGDENIISEIQNNYNCTNDPFLPNYSVDYIYGIPKGAFAVIAIGFIIIGISTFIVIRFIIKKQAQIIQHFDLNRRTDDNFFQRLID